MDQKKRMNPSLPNVCQIWAHATSTIASMKEAIHNDRITAIEGDICMGHCIRNENDNADDDTRLRNKRKDDNDDTIPIMAHPPDRESDLSFTDFFQLAIPNNTLQKHLKLDFKEVDTLGPCLHIVTSQNFLMGTKYIILNADILPGPGRTNQDMTISATQFCHACHKAISTSVSSSKNFALSLGWKVDVCCIYGYQQSHIDDMIKVIEEHQLLDYAGITLAVNARLLSKNMTPFQLFLESYPDTQLLCWVGSGEPPIPWRKVNRIQLYFTERGFNDRVGFDVKATNLLLGTLWDILIWIIGLYKVIRDHSFWNTLGFTTSTGSTNAKHQSLSDYKRERKLQ